MTTSNQPDFYATLGVKPTASAAEIESVYRRALKAASASGTAARAAELQAAYAVIGNPAERSAYDSRLRAGAKERKKQAAIAVANDPALKPLRHHHRVTTKGSSGLLDFVWALFEWFR